MKAWLSKLSSLGSRLIIVILGVPLLLYVILYTQKVFLFFLSLIIFMSWWEMFQMLAITSHFSSSLLHSFIFIMVFIFLVYGVLKKSFLFSGMALFLVFYFLLWMATFSSNTKNQKKVFPYAFFSFYFLFFPLPLFLLFRYNLWGRGAVFYFFVLVWFVDSLAYLGGCSFGGSKLCSKISPKKTISGFIWGFIGGAIWWGIFSFWLEGFFPVFLQRIYLIHLLIATIATTFFIQWGDLLESRIKRMVQKKDSSSLLLGHGGVWDRFDGFIFAIPVYSYLLLYFIK